MVGSVRESIISGTWYPGDPEVLRKTIREYFRLLPDSNLQGDILGLVSPHAGYVYSGSIAAWGYHAVRNSSVRTIFLLSPLHRLFSGKYTVTSHDFYKTPLGTVPINRGLLENIAKKIPLTSVPFDNEHSIEIQLPFLQMVFKDFSIVPIMIGSVDVYRINDCVNALVECFPEKGGLIVASSDLHHIDNYQKVVERDHRVIGALESMDIKRIKTVFDDEECTVCGRAPITIAIETAKKMGADVFHPLKYSNSGDITGDKTPGQYTVGYLSGAILKTNR
jgi:AmmeMemoRadiSam system protein B